MIDLYYCAMPNGLEMVLFSAETGLPHRVIPVDVSRNDQFRPEFLAISLNNKIPAMVDHDPAEGSDPVMLFESGAVLLYLAEKTDQLTSADLHDHMKVLKWLFWQAGGLGPTAGQIDRFSIYTPECAHYTIECYTKKTNRLYDVFDCHLADRPYITGNNYAVADIAAYPWIVPYARHGQGLNNFLNLQRQFEAVGAHPIT